MSDTALAADALQRPRFARISRIPRTRASAGARIPRDGRASEGGAGARILLTAVTDRDTLSEVRYRVFGCPHLIAAAEAACERFEGQPVETLAGFSVAGMPDWLECRLKRPAAAAAGGRAAILTGSHPAHGLTKETERYYGNFTDNTGG